MYQRHRRQSMSGCSVHIQSLSISQVSADWVSLAVDMIQALRRPDHAASSLSVY